MDSRFIVSRSAQSIVKLWLSIKPYGDSRNNEHCASKQPCLTLNLRKSIESKLRRIYIYIYIYIYVNMYRHRGTHPLDHHTANNPQSTTP